MNTSKIKNIRIGEVLKENGYVTEEQISAAIGYQKEHKGVRLGGALIAMGFITEKQMLEALGEKMTIPFVLVPDLDVDVEAVGKLPKQLAEKYCMLPVLLTGDVLKVVVNDPLNYYGIEDIRQVTGYAIELMLAEEAPLRNAIQYYYSEVSARSAAVKANESFQVEDIEELTIDDADDDTPVIQLLTSLIERAYSVYASDIHIEPFEEKTLVRMRIDGVITDYVTLQKSIHNSLIARVKILAELDIAERRIPQDGHFRMKMNGDYFNIRVSLIPTVFGEKAVLRLLASNSRVDNFGTFGMDQPDFEKFNKMIQSPNGIVYLTGPTGSGKSTTLYMVLEELSKRSVNISTIEDPVEKNVPKLNQMQVNNQAGLTFEIGLRALLRQDPDIIMVGETRDAQTASISVRAAITGHLVFSTLHTNDATSTIIRLKDMGLEPYIIANSLVGVVAQRLMRKVCPVCGEEIEMTPDEEFFVGKKLEHMKKGRGCPQCNYTGYRGRIAIHEVLLIDINIRKMITDGASMEEIKAYAIESQGMRTLKNAGVDLVERGISTMEELMKVAYYE